MNLQNLIDLARKNKIEPADLPIAITRDGSQELELGVAHHVRWATGQNEPNILIITIPEESHV